MYYFIITIVAVSLVVGSYRLIKLRQDDFDDPIDRAAALRAMPRTIISTIIVLFASTVLWIIYTFNKAVMDKQWADGLNFIKSNIASLTSSDIHYINVSIIIFFIGIIIFGILFNASGGGRSQ